MTIGPVQWQKSTDQFSGDDLDSSRGQPQNSIAVKTKVMPQTKEIKVIETTVVEHSQISRTSTVRITPRKFTRFD